MISLVRTESELQALLPNGTDCCIVEIPDSRKGARLIAALTRLVKEKDIINQLSIKLPAIAIPKIYLVFAELPKMGSGKVDFRSITEMVKTELAGKGD